MNETVFARNELRAHTHRATQMWITGLAAGIASSPLAAAPFPPESELRDLIPANGGDGSIGVYLEGPTPSDRKGFSIDGAGDIDGDGLDDIVLGAPRDGICDRCAGYIAFGRAALPPSINLLVVPVDSDGADAFVFKSLASDDYGGFSVSRIGDLNGDGFDDFAVGARSADPNGTMDAGEAYVVFGRDSGFPPTFDGEDLLAANGGDGSEGFILSGIATGDETGQSLSGDCDVNADGIDDLVIGAQSNEQVVGRSHVIFGRTSGFPPEFALARLEPANGGDGSEGFEINGARRGDSPGSSMSCAGDVNGDGIDDLVVGTPYASPFDVNSAGEVFVVFGRTDGFPPILSLATLLPQNGGDGSEGFVLLGINAGDWAGRSVASADVNGDGLADMVVGTPNSDANGSNSGRVFVVYGRSALFPAQFSLADLLPLNGGDGSEGFVLNGVSDGYVTGWSVANAGDVNDDDIADFLIGVPSANADGNRPGGAYLVFGRADGFPAMFELSTLLAANGGDGSQGVFLIGAGGANQLPATGTAVGGAGDVNGDGVDDMLIGAPDAALGPLDAVGVGYLVYGRAASADGDGDGVADDADNCSALANADQRDTDADGFGNACDADLNNDCAVNFTDLGELKALFFTSDPDADFNGDGAVNFTDLGIMEAGFFLPPGPSGKPNICNE